MMKWEKYVEIRKDLMFAPIALANLDNVFQILRDDIMTGGHIAGDIAIGYVYPVGEGEFDYIKKSDVTDLAEETGSTVESMVSRIETDTGFAAMEKHPMMICPLFELLQQKAEELGIDLEPQVVPEDGEKDLLYVASNGLDGFGAGVIAYPDFFAQIEKEIGKKSCYLIPSSVDEVLLVTDLEKVPPSELRKILRAANRSNLGIEKCLSNFVYFVDMEQYEISWIVTD